MYRFPRLQTPPEPNAEMTARRNKLSTFQGLLIVMAAAIAGADEKSTPGERIVFDFEDPIEISAWSSAPVAGNPATKVKDPPPRFELSNDNATSGKHSLKITFAGGEWPTIATTRVPADWLTHQTFCADVIVPRPCLVGFTVMQEKSRRGEGWDEMVSRWTKTVPCHAGRNEVVAALRQPNEYSISARFGNVVRLEIFMYEPRDGESIFVDKIRLSPENEAAVSVPKFRLAGTDRTVADVLELGKQLKGDW